MTDKDVLRGVKVLLVDDEEDGREMMAHSLRQYGAQVTAVASARAALEMLPEVKPHVLLSDIAMPGEDGYELIKKVRALHPTRGGQVPAAAVTAFTDRDRRLAAYGAGFEEYLPKPVEPLKLVALVANLAREGGYLG